MNRLLAKPAEPIGLIPAAGTAERLQPLACSKEILPLGVQTAREGRPLVSVACACLLDAMHLAGIRKAYVILRPGKWDVPAYLSDGRRYRLSLAYIVTRFTNGVPYTLDQAYAFSRRETVLCGFPDIIFRPLTAMRRLAQRYQKGDADIVLGLFPASHPHQMDMVKTTRGGVVLGVYPKPQNTSLTYTWILAVWGATFTEFMHRFVRTQSASIPSGTGTREIYLGDLIQAAIVEGLRARSVRFARGWCLDIGTPENLREALRLGVTGSAPRQQTGQPDQAGFHV